MRSGPRRVAASFTATARPSSFDVDETREAGGPAGLSASGGWWGIHVLRSAFGAFATRSHDESTMRRIAAVRFREVSQRYEPGALRFSAAGRDEIIGAPVL
jgi:hypothetical protein